MTGPLGPVTPGSSPEDPRARLLAASRQLEAVFLQQMLQAMRKATPTEGGLLEPSAGEQAFREMFDESLARLAAAASERGPGMAIYRQLIRHLPVGGAAPDGSSGTQESHHGVQP